MHIIIIDDTPSWVKPFNRLAELYTEDGGEESMVAFDASSLTLSQVCKLVSSSVRGSQFTLEECFFVIDKTLRTFDDGSASDLLVELKSKFPTLGIDNFWAFTSADTVPKQHYRIGKFTIAAVLPTRIVKPTDRFIDRIKQGRWKPFEDQESKVIADQWQNFPYPVMICCTETARYWKNKWQGDHPFSELTNRDKKEYLLNFPGTRKPNSKPWYLHTYPFEHYTIFHAEEMKEPVYNQGLNQYLLEQAINMGFQRMRIFRYVVQFEVEHTSQEVVKRESITLKYDGPNVDQCDPAWSFISDEKLKLYRSLEKKVLAAPNTLQYELCGGNSIDKDLLATSLPIQLPSTYSVEIPIYQKLDNNLSSTSKDKRSLIRERLLGFIVLDRFADGNYQPIDKKFIDDRKASIMQMVNLLRNRHFRELRNQTARLNSEMVALTDKLATTGLTLLQIYNLFLPVIVDSVNAAVGYVVDVEVLPIEDKLQKELAISCVYAKDETIPTGSQSLIGFTTVIPEDQKDLLLAEKVALSGQYLSARNDDGKVNYMGHSQQILNDPVRVEWADVGNKDEIIDYWQNQTKCVLGFPVLTSSSSDTQNVRAVIVLHTDEPVGFDEHTIASVGRLVNMLSSYAAQYEFRNERNQLLDTLFHHIKGQTNPLNRNLNELEEALLSLEGEPDKKWLRPLTAVRLSSNQIHAVAQSQLLVSGGEGRLSELLSNVEGFEPIIKSYLHQFVPLLLRRDIYITADHELDKEPILKGSSELFSIVAVNVLDNIYSYGCSGTEVQWSAVLATYNGTEVCQFIITNSTNRETVKPVEHESAPMITPGIGIRASQMIVEGLGGRLTPELELDGDELKYKLTILWPTYGGEVSA